MTDDETRELRTAHAKAMKDLGKAADALEQAEMAAGAVPSWAHRIGLYLVAAGHRMIAKIEQDARAKARKTYD